MVLHKNKELKLYYSIKEVANEIGVNESTLRYWETEFPQIAPKKGANNVRRYTKDDIKTIRLVHHLVKNKGLTLAGAKQYLKQNGNKETAETNSSVIERLKAVREELLAIKSALEHL